MPLLKVQFLPSKSPSDLKPSSLPSLMRYQLYTRGFHDPLFGLIDLVEQLTGLREPIYLKDYWIITTDIKGYKSTAR